MFRMKVTKYMSQFSAIVFFICIVGYLNGNLPSIIPMLINGTAMVLWIKIYYMEKARYVERKNNVQ